MLHLVGMSKEAHKHTANYLADRTPKPSPPGKREKDYHRPGLCRPAPFRGICQTPPDNTPRDLNIALMNELALIFGQLGIDTLEVLEAAGSKWNFLPFRPGLVGGHCHGAGRPTRPGQGQVCPL